jgi:glutamate-1-semialdehyde 2,1-aminomutase
MVKNLNQANVNYKLFRQAKSCLAGGVNSPVRSFKAVGGAPVFIKEALASKFLGEDGKTYIDYCLSWGALLLGHAHPAVIREVKKAVCKGTSYGAPTKIETEFAKVITKAVPAMERIRLVSSGTEAAMSVIRIARGYTKKNKLIKFKECYHGHSDYFLSGKSAGIPGNLSRDVISLDYNNLKQVEEVLEKDKDVACVIVEPIAANTGLILPLKSFLAGLRKLTLKHKALLIFDEVITGFRFCFGGAQNIFGIDPDLTCLGKIIGGGFPLACFGGKLKIMQQLAPEGGVYQAGTLSGNPVAVSAGFKTLEILKAGDFYKKLNAKSDLFYRKLDETIENTKAKVFLNRFGPMFNFCFQDKNKFYLVVNFCECILKAN